MKRRKRLPYTFTRLAGEAYESIQTVIRVAFGELLKDDVETWLRDTGRGMVFFQFKDSTVGSIQPPVYISLPAWRNGPPLISPAVQDEVSSALINYRPDREYIVFIAAVDGDYEGTYAWWREPLPTIPGAFDLWKR